VTGKERIEKLLRHTDRGADTHFVGQLIQCIEQGADLEHRDFSESDCNFVADWLAKECPGPLSLLDVCDCIIAQLHRRDKSRGQIRTIVGERTSMILLHDFFGDPPDGQNQFERLQRTLARFVEPRGASAAEIMTAFFAELDSEGQSWLQARETDHLVFEIKRVCMEHDYSATHQPLAASDVYYALGNCLRRDRGISGGVTSWPTPDAR
jgi:hypothetical protein